MQLKNIEKKTIINWIAVRTLWVGVFYAITHLYVVYADIPQRGLWVAILVLIGIADGMAVANAWIMPILQQARYGYCIREDEIYIERGVIFKETTLLPIVQLQDVGYTEGPIERLLGLATLHVSTAGSDVHICGISKQQAVAIVQELNQKAQALVVEKRLEDKA